MYIFAIQYFMAGVLSLSFAWWVFVPSVGKNTVELGGWEGIIGGLGL